jgi:hypothetical protein
MPSLHTRSIDKQIKHAKSAHKIDLIESISRTPCGSSAFSIASISAALAPNVGFFLAVAVCVTPLRGLSA